MSGCCTSCQGTGTSAGDPETNGRCGDCRGTGHTHDGPCEPWEPTTEELALFAAARQPPRSKRPPIGSIW